MLSHIDSDVFNRLTQNELSIFRYIDAHKEDVIHMSIQELAAKNYTSTSTVLRLCRKLGLEGYSELKYMMKSSRSQTPEKEDKRRPEEEILQENFEIIENTSRLLDMKSLDTVCNWLFSKRKIHLYAGGLSSPVLEYMQRFLLSAGRSCFFYNTAPLAYRAAGKMTAKDMLLIASASGATPSVTRIAQIAKNSGAALISVTNLDNNPLSQLADIRFFTFIGNRDYYGTDIKSRSPLFFIIDSILECYLYRLEQADSLEGGDHLDT